MPVLFGEKFYTVPEASEATGLAQATIWEKLKLGALIRTKIAGKTVIRESELRKLIIDLPLPKKAAEARKPRLGRPRTKTSTTPAAVAQ